MSLAEPVTFGHTIHKKIHFSFPSIIELCYCCIAIEYIFCAPPSTKALIREIGKVGRNYNESHLVQKVNCETLYI